MSFWSKLGKIGLAAAPYVAAPFTGGASLAFAPAANAALQKWNQHDAESNAAKGIAPSSFDKYVGLGSGIAGMASGASGGFGMGGAATAGQGGGWQGQLGKIGNMTTNAMSNSGFGSGPVQGNPNAMSATSTRQGINPSADTNRLSGSRQGGTNNPYYQQVRGQKSDPNQGQGDSGPSWQEFMQYMQGQGGQGGGMGPSYQYPQGGSGGGSGNIDPSKFRQYTGEDVGHEGTTRGGMNRQQYRDSWMGSGIGNNQQMDAWLASNGGQRLNDSGVVRTPFGEILDMGIGYKGGRGQAGWTDIGMNNLAANQGWGQAYNPPPQQPIGPSNEPEAPEPSYEDFVRDYWAPDRDAVLAARAPQNQPQQPPANQAYARKIGRGGQYVNA